MVLRGRKGVVLLCTPRSSFSVESWTLETLLALRFMGSIILQPPSSAEHRDYGYTGRDSDGRGQGCHEDDIPCARKIHFKITAYGLFPRHVLAGLC